jgi:hypothetical protein
MKKHIMLGALAVLAGSLTLAHGSPKDDVQAAAKKLGDNYTWKTTVENAGGGGGGGRFGGGPSDGKTAGGETWVTIARRDTTMDAVMIGTNKGALKTQDGWRSFAEATQDDGGGGFNPTLFTARMLQNFKAPASQAAELAGQAQELKVEGDAIVGNLTEAGAKSLLSFRRGPGGGDAPEPRNAKGSVKFWVKDGKLAKYEYKIQGTVTFGDNDRDIDRTTTVDIKDVGTTKIEVPDEARKKLS